MEGPEQGFRRCFVEGFNKSLVSSAKQAIWRSAQYNFLKTSKHDLKAAILVWENNNTAAMLMYQKILLGLNLLSHFTIRFF